MKLRSYLEKYGRPLLAFFVVLFLLPACIIVVDEDDDDDDYYRRRWELDIIVYSSGYYTPAEDGVYTVSFSANEAVSGQADCVQFEGRYQVGRSSTLTIDGLSSGSASCGEDSIAGMFLDELKQARSISGDADELVIHLEGTDNLMRFRPY